LPNACLFLTEPEAIAIVGAPVDGDSEQPDPDGNVDSRVCTYSGRTWLVPESGSVPLLNVEVRKGGQLALPSEGTLLTEDAISRYPALGGGAASPTVAVRRGDVGGEPAAWYTVDVSDDNDEEETLFTTLATSSGRYGIFVSVSATPDNIAVAKRAAAAVQDNLAGRQR
jgi:hypothetical protein